MIQEPAESPYDLHFDVLGFPTRVTWGFWVAAVVLGWGACNSWDASFSQINVDSPGAPILLVIWSAAMFVSILVHELGHALAMRFYGLPSRMVLYHLGGIAIANSFGAWDGARRSSLSARDSLLIAAAGPAAQLTLAGVVYAVGRFLGMQLELDWLMQDYFAIEPPVADAPSSAAAFALFNSLVTPSVLWALLNLLPILPLDGGNILLNMLLLTKNRAPQRNSHLVSIFVAVLVAAYSLQTGSSMLAMMCFVFAAINWQQLQFQSGRF
jgi:stage IV sporulation protein FB